MKKALKRSLCVLVAVCIVFSSAFTGFTGFDFSKLFVIKADAASVTGQQVKAYVESYVGNSWGSGMCLDFVATMFQRLGGTRTSACCAINYANSYRVSSSQDNIPIGADVYFNNTTDYTCSCGSRCGHIGIYVGDGYMVHASGGVVRKDKLSYVSNYYGWGYHGGITITSAKPSDAWVSLPDGNESSYKINTDVPITIGANNARYYTIVMYRDGEHYYEETFYNESGSHTIPASFDKTGHYSCYVIARYTYDGEFVTSSWQGWDIVDDVPQNLTVSVNKPLGRDFYPGETVNVTATATYVYKKYVCIHKVDGSFYAGSYVDGTDFSCVVNEPGEYYVNFEAFNACGSNLSYDVYFTVADVDAYILMPDSNGYSYLLNEEVPMTMVAPGATHFTIVMQKDGEFYYENMFYNEAGSHTIPASFDKAGHYTGYLIATNSSGMEVFSELYSWDIVDDVPQNLSISTNKNFFYPGETVEFTMKAENGNKKYIGIHKADGTFFNGGYLLEEEYDFRTTTFGDYYADFEAMNAYGSKISEKVYFSVKDIYPLDEETSVDFSNNFIYTDKYSLQNINTILGYFSNTKVSIVNEDLLYYGTGTSVSVTTADSPVTYTLVVNGDTNGDSVCDVLDASQVALVSNGHRTLDGAYAMAADSNSDDMVDVTDYQSIVNKAVS